MRASSSKLEIVVLWIAVERLLRRHRRALYKSKTSEEGVPGSLGKSSFTLGPEKRKESR